MSFGPPLRRYQDMILRAEGPRLDAPAPHERFHIVSPPGSGKTILGLEMIHRLGENAVVFAPTTTIQQQWADKARMFCDSDAQHAELVSTDPRRIAPLTILTYQVISTVGEAPAALRAAARTAWEEELAADGSVTPEQATARLDAMREHHASAYRTEIDRRVKTLRRRWLRGEDADLERMLHANARALIDALLAAGVRTVVLDECHHLLDYWALVLSHLIDRIDTPRVIGLTATLPSTEDEREFENYTSLLGDVTFEVPTPAVVKEGDLAPYRDLVAFVWPDVQESAFLDGAREAFAATVADLTGTQAFAAWIAAGGPGAGEDPPTRWRQALKERAPAAVAALRYAHARQILPADVPVPAAALQEPDADDALLALERFALDYLKVSPDPEDHARLTRLRGVLAPFGLALTEAGLRARRAVAESTISYSRAKAFMAGDILTAEHAALGPRYRAVVVTDFEKTGSLLPGGNPQMAHGSARAVFAELVHHPTAHALDAVLVTGQSLWLDADNADAVLAWCAAWLTEQGLDARCRATEGEIAGTVCVLGEGRHWNTGTYVSMITAALEAGVVTTLVGTRALFAEGWDALSLSVLVDLTTAATSTSTQQIRGRTLRLDPTWSTKVAHNWDVVCLPPHPRLPRTSLADMTRLRRRHRAVWGVVPDYGTLPEWVGMVSKGVIHVDPELLRVDAQVGEEGRMPQANPRKPFEEITRRSFAQIGRREWSYRVWDVGGEYGNVISTETTFTPPTAPLTGVFTLEHTLRRLLAQFRATLGGVLMMALAAGADFLGRSQASVLIAVGVFTLVALVWGIRASVPVVRELLRGDHPDLALRDIGRAVVGALVELRLISVMLEPDDVEVVENMGLTYTVHLPHADSADAALFAQCMAQALAPLARQRYVISRRTSRLPRVWLRPVWVVLRYLRRVDRAVTYHPVPDVFGARKNRAEVYARHWRRNVGGGELVFTHSAEGLERLFAIARRQQPTAASATYDVWR